MSQTTSGLARTTAGLMYGASGLSEPQRQALLDLLILGMYSDDNLSRVIAFSPPRTHPAHEELCG